MWHCIDALELCFCTCILDSNKLHGYGSSICIVSWVHFVVLVVAALDMVIFVDNNLETVEVVFYMVQARFDYSDILVVEVLVVTYVALCECIPSMMRLLIVGQKLMDRW